MFTHLIQVLKLKNISIRSYSRWLGASESSAQNKLRGRTEFTFSEIKKTKELLPEYDINWLFFEISESKEETA